MESATPSQPAPKKIEELESLRGIAATLVIFVHIPAWNPLLHNIAFFRNGTSMVDLFFVLSGFVICKIYGNRLDSPKDVLRFQLLRFGRLYPVHLLFLLAFLSLEILKWGTSEAALANFAAAPFAFNDWSAFTRHLFLIQALGDSSYLATFNGPAWSISVEFYCYILFALVVLLSGRIKWLVFATLAVIAMASFFVPIIDNSAIYRCIGGFFTGCLVAGIASRPWSFRIPGWAQMATFAAFFAYVGFFPQPQEKIGVFLIAALLILCIVRGEESLLRRLLRTRPLVAIGAWSYSIYMSHALVIYIMLQATIRLTNRPLVAMGETMLPQFSLIETLALYAVLFTTVMLLSRAIYLYYENPARMASRRMIFAKLGQSSAPAPATAI